MNAIFGCLLSLGGTVLMIDDFVNREYRVLWLPVLFLSVGLFMALRHRPDDDDVIDLRDGQATCSTCRGSGTVYSAEWNDWRKAGPVLNIRELCPACEGLDVSNQQGDVRKSEVSKGPEVSP